LLDALIVLSLSFLSLVFWRQQQLPAACFSLVFLAPTATAWGLLLSLVFLAARIACPPYVPTQHTHVSNQKLVKKKKYPYTMN
jgi:hypothetical protein